MNNSWLLGFSCQLIDPKVMSGEYHSVISDVQVDIKFHIFINTTIFWPHDVNNLNSSGNVIQGQGQIFNRYYI